MRTNDDLSSSGFARLVADKTPVVEKIARNLSRKLPTSVERDDLVQDGMVGLIDAILRWTRETTSSHFDNYVAQRAQGAMLDGLRANDPGSRSLRRAMRAAEQVIQRLGHQKGRPPLESGFEAPVEGAHWILPRRGQCHFRIFYEKRAIRLRQPAYTRGITLPPQTGT